MLKPPEANIKKLDAQDTLPDPYLAPTASSTTLLSNNAIDSAIQVAAKEEVTLNAYNIHIETNTILLAKLFTYVKKIKTVRQIYKKPNPKDVTASKMLRNNQLAASKVGDLLLKGESNIISLLQTRLAQIALVSSLFNKDKELLVWARRVAP
ncbi:hypothetical protein BDU57DRAFT_533814 [Ampelomyces quisqualis]|uniref:Uncharacterized protein n=1 Tax=Ampelomyces quisqualis TaxID=50730 RepID=A0A6A5Q9C3_AMPQU|nr:hypothetical protein BDU57DRAFT_533814 [Ampelomyces quisqualis]